MMPSNKNFYVKRRTFEANKYEKGSPMWIRLNKKAMTSAKAKHLKFCVFDAKTNKPCKCFRNLDECNDFMNNPDKYKQPGIKKYTRDMFIKGGEYFRKKRSNLNQNLRYS